MKDLFSGAARFLGPGRFPLVLVCMTVGFGFARAEEAAGLQHYEEVVLPILEANCLKCHGAEKHKSEFRMDYRNRVLGGGELSDGVDPEKPLESFLVKAINYVDEEHEMPPKGKLAAEEIAAITRWIEGGAPMPADQLVLEEAPRELPHVVTDERKQYWAYRPVEKPAMPVVKSVGWNDHPVDALVASKVEEAGLACNPPASREVLIRRATYDLTGLPPTPGDVKAFVDDAADDEAAFAKVVERLLASPRYGEKWGRHWLDLVRYAESNGYERDSFKPEVWRYRDWVIKAFNENLPYDEFIKRQLAGDEIDPNDPEMLIPTGFYRLGLWDDEPADRLLQKYDILDGAVDTTARSFLAMSVGCARCHDHKIDPIPQKDYYSFLAFFHNVKSMNDKAETTEVRLDREAFEAANREKERDMNRIQADMAGIEEEFRVAFEREEGAVGLIDMVDVRYRFYRDTFEKLPDFDALRHENEGALASGFFEPGVATRKDFIGFVFEGTLRLPHDGTYTFHLDSHHGSRLRINGEVLIDHDGDHPYGLQKSKGLKLKKGTAKVRLDWFKGTGPLALNLSWNGPGVPLRALTRSPVKDGTVLIPDGRDGGAMWRWTTDAPPGDWMQSAFDDSAWAENKSGFGRKGTPRVAVATPWHGKEIWLRKVVELEAVPWMLRYSLYHDEDVEVYINGALILSKKGYIVDYEKKSLPGGWRKIMKPGRNVVAVRCKQTVGGQGIDFGLHVGTKKEGKNEPLGMLLKRQGKKVLGEARVKDYDDLKKKLEAVRKRKVDTGVVRVFAVKENGTRLPQTHILRRGNPHVKGDAVEPAFPSILTSAMPSPPVVSGSSSGWRTVLAEWIGSPENPLTARVMVNRMWQFHFGRGLVRTPSDFGKIGSGNTHPALLDFLAHTFANEMEWDIKAMHRMLMLSRTYRMSSAGNEAALAKDPGNDLFWRFNMRRLTAEEIRDSIIGLTGKLNFKMGGDSFYSELPEAVLKTASNNKWGKSSEEERNRRAVYLKIRRSLLDPLMTSFDQADTDNPCPVRFSTTVPTQSLTLLNSAFSSRKSKAFAERLRGEADSLEGQVRKALELAFSRTVTADEVKNGLEVVEDLGLEHFCLLVINLNEFLFID